MKRNRIIASALAFAMLCTFALSGCGDSAGDGDKTKVGMVTDSGTISDRSFNQGTWEGIQKYEKDKGTISSQYLKPSGEQETDYLNAINDLVDTDYNLIVTPGYKFETAVNKAASEHEDTTFVLIDGQPHISDKDLKFVKHDNVVSVFFNEHEAGFLAGVAAALSTKTNKLGFIGGMEIPAVQKFGWGYQAGVKYANDTFGTKAEIVNYVYQGTFNDVQAGQTLAAGMYDKGVDIIFHASGGVGVGVFNEAKQRANNGKNVWVIGVDSDQYELGKISKAKDAKSVTLTSAVKKVDVAAYNFIDDKLNNKFPGGEVVTLTIRDDAVGLPKDNPNLSDDAKAKLEDAKKALLDGKVKAPSTEAELKEFLK